MATQGALAALQESAQSPLEFLSRHSTGDWGNVGQDDWALNDMAIEGGDRILNAYKTLKGVNVWVVTEADRSSTCILLPGEY